jgi:hypothetical protein
LQRKGKGGDGEQVKVCLACFSGTTCRFFLQAVAIKTAQVSRAEKNGQRFPTPAAQQSIYANDLYLLLTMLQGISDFCA